MPRQLTVGELRRVLSKAPDEVVVGLALPPDTPRDDQLTILLNVEATYAGGPVVHLRPVPANLKRDGRAETHSNVDWIPEDGLRAWLEIVSGANGYAFDADDWGAFLAHLKGTDAEGGNWFEYPLGGGPEPPIVRVALERGTALAMISVAGNSELRRCAMLATSTIQRYRLSPRV